MTTSSAHAPSSTTSSSKPDGADFEPDEEWKRQLKKRIEDGLQSMVKDAKESQVAELKKAPVSQDVRLRLEAEYKQAMSNIKELANEQYQMELDRERNQRLWTAGFPMHPGWTRRLQEEQQYIMNNIKQNGNQADRPASESPTDERRPVIPSRPVNEAPPSEPPEPPPPSQPQPAPPVPPPPPPQHKEEREKLASPPVPPPAPPPPAIQTPRRGSDARSTASRDRDEYPGSGSIRRQRGSNHERPQLTDTWTASEVVKESEETLRPSPSRPRPSVDPSPVTPDAPRWDASLGRSSGSIRSVSDRHMARSPPKPTPEVWTPTVTAAEDASTSKTYSLGRRDSTTSMRSTGSGTSIRPISETIPERIDDISEEGSSVKEHDRDRNYEQDKTRKYADKAREKEKRRRGSRPSPVDPTIYKEEPPLASSALRSAGTSSATMQYATSSTPIKPLSSKSSFQNGDERYHPAERPTKPPSYVDPRDQRPAQRDSPYSHREPPYSVRDLPPPSARPVPPRSPYGGDDRDYTGAYPPMGRPPVIKPPFAGDRDYRGPHPPISHKSSFNYEDRRGNVWDRESDPHWDDDRDHRDRDWDYRDRDWDRERENRDRERDRDRDRDIYADPRHLGHYPYTSRPSGYPTPPSSAARRPSHDYLPMNDLYDDRDNAPPPRGYGYRNQAPDSDEWEYARPESARPPLPTRQPSYSRRDDPDRRMGPDIDKYPPRPYANPPLGSIPIPRHAPSSEDMGLPGWQAWAAEGGARRPSDARYDYHARSPVADHFSRRRTGHPPPYSGSPHDDAHAFDGRDSTQRAEHDEDDEDEEQGSDDEPRQPLSEEQSEDDEDEEEEEVDDLDARALELEAERKEADEKIKEKELEIQRLVEEEKRLEEEAKRKEEEVRKKEEDFMKKEQEAKQLEEEVKKKEEEVIKKEEEAKRKEQEAKRKEKEAKRKEQEARRKADEAKQLELEAERKAEEAKRKEDEIKKKEEQTRRKEERLKEDAEKTRKLQLEARRIAEDAQKKQESLRKLEEETRKKEQEIKEREAALFFREEELKRREAEAKKKEEETKRKDEAKQKEEEAKRKEEAKKKEEAARREEARLRDEKVRREQEARRQQEADRYHIEDVFDNLDPRIVEEQQRLLQQAQFRKREEDIKRSRAEERKRHDSVGNDSAWSGPSTSPGMSRPPPQFTSAPSATDRLSGNSSWSSPGSAWSSPTKQTPVPSATTGRSSTGLPPAAAKPRTGSVSSGTHPTSSSPHTAPPISESDWARRHAEFTNDQQEKFRREQEKLEADRQMRSAGKPLSREDVQRVLEQHERLWSRLPSISELTWADFPWPMMKMPANPDDISFTLISGYFQSPVWSDKEKSRMLKDRIKDHLRRWHPDRFDSKTLPRVVESEKEKVKLGAGNVVRYLNDLLRKENENINGSSNPLFGGD